MPVPSSTYRLQLHAGFTFHDAAAVVDYLADLGVSHVYCSPVLQAVPGSEHGYDVVDHRRLSADLGGEEGWAALRDACRAAGLGVVVDVVPNHMATAPEAEPWQELLRDGPASPRAHWFDVDWDAQDGRVLLPVLGRPLGDCLRDGELVAAGDAVRYAEHRFPLRGEPGPLAARLDRQPYRLAYWRVGAEELNYRRFFDVPTLAGLRAEDADVFAATHDLLLAKVRAGEIDGLRIDHPDGLADPRQYLRRLAAATGGAWVVVEKILQPGERLPPDWPTAGTTGYEAIRRLSGVLADPAGAGPLTELYAELTGEPIEFAAVAAAAKELVATQTLAAEVARLTRLAVRHAREQRADLSARGLRQALEALLAAFPVYRAYAVPGEPAPPTARQQVAAATQQALGALPGRERELRFLADAVLAGPPELVVRFQQTTGPVLAKGVEDTAFYRYHRLAALAEVGGDPGRVGLALADFHAAAAAMPPAGMTTLSTHDTKRSEDVRARLLVLAELPRQWGAAVRRWRAAHRLASDPNLEYLAWQTLVGAWPISRERLGAYLRKAAREAKLRTSWTDPAPGYDEALEAFVDGLYADPGLLEAVAAFLRDVLEPAATSNSLTQKLVQLTLPGVPDVYQGSELPLLALVDPDNRRPVDFGTARLALAGAPPPAKLRVTSAALRLRRDRPELFGAYRPLSAGEHLLAFLRGDRLAVLGTRLPATLRAAGGWGSATVDLPAGRWHDVIGGAVHEGGQVRLGAALGELPVALLVRGAPGEP